MGFNSSARAGGRCAWTLVETLIAVSILGMLTGLLLPGLHVARERSRRVSCQNNLKQVGVAVQNYEATNGHLPIGARSYWSKTTSNPTFGVSWWVDLLPYIDQTPLYAGLDLDTDHQGWAVLHPKNGRAIDKKFMSNLWCPSSSLAPMIRINGYEVMTPSYVGISGASNDDLFPEARVSRCCLPENGGEISSGGLLLAHASVRVGEISDGLSHVLLAGECSDLAWDNLGRPRRIDGAFPNGWITGTAAWGTPPNYDQQPSPCWNVTTIRYGVNVRDYNLPGIDENRGANNPLTSAHPNGLNVLKLDGSVPYLADDTDVMLLKSLATRDDGRF